MCHRCDIEQQSYYTLMRFLWTVFRGQILIDEVRFDIAVWYKKTSKLSKGDYDLMFASIIILLHLWSLYAILWSVFWLWWRPVFICHTQSPRHWNQIAIQLIAPQALSIEKFVRKTCFMKLLCAIHIHRPADNGCRLPDGLMLVYNQRQTGKMP